jgi:hypothetical protein
VVGREHDPDGARDQVERGVRYRQVLRVALQVGDVEVLGGGALATLLEQVRGVVDAGRHREAARGGHGRVALPARDVQHPLAGAHVGDLHQLFRDDLQGVADTRVVAGLPARALVLLDRLEVGRDRHWCFSLSDVRSSVGDHTTGRPCERACDSFCQLAVSFAAGRAGRQVHRSS